MKNMLKILLLFNILTISFGTEYLVTDQIFLDVEHNGEPLGRIVLGLFGQIAPKTVQNFITITTIGINNNTYKNSSFHRVIPRFMIQGGDILAKNGTGSISINGKYFPDENFEVKHTGPGFIAMANAGYQFYITTIATPWLDGYHTIFGKVIKGQNIVHKIEQIKTDSDDQPLNLVLIINSGVIETTSFTISDQFYDIWGWINASLVPFGMSFTILGTFHWMIKKLDI